jgi:hypothetical protein
VSVSDALSLIEAIERHRGHDSGAPYVDCRRVVDLQDGLRIAIVRSNGIVRAIEPTLGESELHLVVQLTPSGFET